MTDRATRASMTSLTYLEVAGELVVGQHQRLELLAEARLALVQRGDLFAQRLRLDRLVAEPLL